MSHFTMIFLVLALVQIPFGTAASAHEKPLPPAFGKEIVSDEATAEHNEPKNAELEEEHEGGGTRAHSGGHGGGHGGKIHIELDGDEDGGGSGDDDDGGF